MGMKWAEKNTWFQNDPEMTGYAFGVHEKLIKSGVVQTQKSTIVRFTTRFAVSSQISLMMGLLLRNPHPNVRLATWLPLLLEAEKTTQSATDLNASLSPRGLVCQMNNMRRN